MSSSAKEALLAQEILKPMIRAYRKTRPLGSASLIEQLLYGLLQRWFPIAKAEAILKALQTEFVDMNEVRVSHMTEIDGVLESLGFTDSHEAAQGIKDLLVGYHLLRNDLEEEYFEALAPEERISFLGGIPVLEPWMIHYIMLTKEPEGSALYQVDLSRVAQRTGLIPRTSSPKKVVEGLLALDLGPELLGMQLYLIRVGTEVCGSRSYDCTQCRINKLCAVGEKTLKQIADKEAKAQAKASEPKPKPKATKKKATKKKATAKKATAKKATAKKATAKKATAKKATAKKKSTTKKTAAKKTAKKRTTTRPGTRKAPATKGKSKASEKA